jgi:hypothetical protein
VDAVMDALKFGVRVTWWIFKNIFLGYYEVVRWAEARRRGVFVPFPVFPLSLAIVLTGGCLGFFILSSSQDRIGQQTQQATYQPTPYSGTPRRVATATAKAIAEEEELKKAQFYLSPTSQNVSLGEQFDVQVMLDPGVNRIENFRFRLTYPQQVRFINFVPQGVLGDSRFLETPGVGLRSVSLSWDCSDPCISYIEEVEVVATITFEGSPGSNVVYINFDQNYFWVNASQNNLRTPGSAKINIIQPK